MYNKKSQVRPLRNMILRIIAFAVIVSILGWVFINVLPDKAKESACFYSNAIRSDFNVDFKVGKIATPRTCATIQKEIPQKELKIYEPNAEGAKKQLGNLVSECWKSWLEGTDKSIFSAYIIPREKNNCFICYEFTLKDEISFSAFEFDKELDEMVHQIVERDDKCSNENEQGFCVDGSKCEEGYKQVTSNQCNADQTCCKHPINICENKGGECIKTSKDDEGVIEGKKPHPLWPCKLGFSCYVDKENIITKKEYIQNSESVGKIVVDRENIQNFNSDGTYAVTFISETNNFPAMQNIPLVGRLIQTDISQILVSRYKDIEENCNIKFGIGD